MILTFIGKCLSHTAPPRLAAALLVCISALGCVAVPIPYKGYPHKTIKGVVFDKSKGVPLEEASVHFYYYPNDDPTIEQETQPDGSFMIKPERRWRYYYLLFALGELPVFSKLVIQKEGYETAKIKMLLPHQLGWMRNYRIFNSTDDLGRIELTLSKKEKVTEYYAAPVLFSFGRPKLVEIEKPAGREAKTKRDP